MFVYCVYTCMCVWIAYYQTDAHYNISPIVTAMPWKNCLHHPGQSSTSPNPSLRSVRGQPPRSWDQYDSREFHRRPHWGCSVVRLRPWLLAADWPGRQDTKAMGESEECKLLPYIRIIRSNSFFFAHLLHLYVDMIAYGILVLRCMLRIMLAREHTCKIAQKFEFGVNAEISTVYLKKRKKIPLLCVSAFLYRICKYL